MAFPDTQLTIQWIAGPPYELIDSVKMYNRVDVNLNLLALRVVDTGWTVVSSFANSWVSFDGGVSFPVPQYRLKAGIVYLHGLMKLGSGGSGVIAFTLPVGMRPLLDTIFLGQAGPGLARIDVLSTGAVCVTSYISSGSNANVSLDNIRFVAEQ